MSMECGPEQPFFVIGQGWKSAAPEKTRENFGLNATLLEVSHKLDNQCILINFASTLLDRVGI